MIPKDAAECYDRIFSRLKKRVSPETVERIRAIGLPNVDFEVLRGKLDDSTLFYVQGLLFLAELLEEPEDE